MPIQTGKKIDPPTKVDLIPTPNRGHSGLRERRRISFLEPSIITSLPSRAYSDRWKTLAIRRMGSWVWWRGGADALVPSASAVYTHRKTDGREQQKLNKERKEGRREGYATRCRPDSLQRHQHYSWLACSMGRLVEYRY
jgi:hypothetical protein